MISPTPIEPSASPEAHRPRRASSILTAVVDPLQDPSWDDKVAAFEDATIFHTAGWAQVLCDTYRYRPRYVVAMQGRSLAGVLPLMEIRSTIAGARGVSLPSTDFCPPLTRNQDVTAALLGKARDLAVDRNWEYFELHGAPIEGVRAARSFAEHLMPLEDDPSLISRCRPEVRLAIRNAGRGGVSVAVEHSALAVRDFYRLHCRMCRRQGFPARPMSFFRNIHHRLLTRGQGSIILARVGDQAVSGSIALHFGHRASCTLTASEPGMASLQAAHEVMWHGIQTCRQQGCNSLSTGRARLQDITLRRFMAGWGAQEQFGHYARWETQGESWSTLDNAWNSRRSRVTRFTPFSVLRLAGDITGLHSG